MRYLDLHCDTISAIRQARREDRPACLRSFTGQVNLERMKQAADYLIGTHDFKSFCGNKKMKKTTVRTLMKVEFQVSGSELAIRYTGNGFLQYMVRIMTGTLIEVGLGVRNPETMPAVLEACSREAAGFTAPPEGLCLEKVRYGS